MINLSVSKVQSDNFSDYIDSIQTSIDKFNSQINWGNMWDLNEAQERLLNENILDYLLLISVNNSIIPSSVMIPITFPLFSGSTIGMVSNG